jgi:hypothetical protein
VVGGGWASRAGSPYVIKCWGVCAIGDYEIKHGHAVLDELFSFVLFFLSWRVDF